MSQRWERGVIERQTDRQIQRYGETDFFLSLTEPTWKHTTRSADSTVRAD